MLKNKAKVLCIEAAVGFGKSTLLDVLQKRLNFNKIVIVPEPVDKWNESGIITEFYADIKGKAMEFQHYAFITRLQALERAFSEEPEADLYILERSPLSDRHIFVDMLYQSGFITINQLNRYIDCWQSWQKLWPVKPTHFIFLNCQLMESMSRIEKRNRPGENISVDYQKALIAKCGEFCAKISLDYPTLQLDCNSDYTQDGLEQDKIVTTVQQFLYTN